MLLNNDSQGFRKAQFGIVRPVPNMKPRWPSSTRGHPNRGSAFLRFVFVRRKCRAPLTNVRKIGPAGRKLRGTETHNATKLNDA